MKKLLMAAAAAAMALSVAACDKSHDLTQPEKAMADHGGLLFANSAGGQFLQCSGRDSDGDGYVTCQARLPERTAAGGRALEQTELSCSYRGQPGCKSKR